MHAYVPFLIAGRRKKNTRREFIRVATNFSSPSEDATPELGGCEIRLPHCQQCRSESCFSCGCLFAGCHFPCIALQKVSLTRGRRLPVCLKWSCLPAAREVGALPLRQLLSLEFSPSFSSLTLWPTLRLPGLLISRSSRRGQRANASWEKERREGELPRQVKGSRNDILLICC